MPRIITRQPAVARPVGIYVAGLGTTFNEVIEVPDYSVPDPNRNWPNSRDPNDDDRRIVPGMVMLEAPLLCHNTSTSPVILEIRIFPEDQNNGVMQARIEIPGQDTYQHPVPGQRLVKRQITSINGDSLQLKASVGGVVHVTGAASVGSAEQDQPPQLGLNTP